RQSVIAPFRPRTPRRFTLGFAKRRDAQNSTLQRRFPLELADADNHRTGRLAVGGAAFERRFDRGVMCLIDESGDLSRFVMEGRVRDRPDGAGCGSAAGRAMARRQAPSYPSTGSDRHEPTGGLVIQVSTGALLFIARQRSSLRIGMCVSSAPVALRIALPRAGPTEIIGCS